MDSNFQGLSSKTKNEQPNPAPLLWCKSWFTLPYLTAEFCSSYLLLILMSSGLQKVAAHP